ncbi:lysin A [Arthrobacter phage Giantsbane]|nr:lysin A [Arthrobacter phage Giantsbane]
MVLPINGINEQFNAAFFTPGPTQKDGIVIHWWGLPQGQTIQSVRDTFGGGGRQASAHYGCSDGVVDCYVSPDDVAWANGHWGANLSKISIECDPRQSDGDYYAAAWTVAYIRSIYGDLPLSRHDNYFATQCCGTYDIARIDRLARTINVNTASKPTPAKPAPVKPAVPAVKGKTIAQLADEVLKGAYGTGDQRRLALGANFQAVQDEVNRRLSGAANPKPKPNISALADQVLAGKFGTGDQRITALGVNYQAVQDEVNRRINAKPTAKPAPKPVVKPAPKPVVNISDLVRRTLNGEFGNGDERKRRLGANYQAVQNAINAGAKPNINDLVARTLKGEFGNGDERIRRLGSNYNAVQAEINRRYS